VSGPHDPNPNSEGLPGPTGTRVLAADAGIAAAFVVLFTMGDLDSGPDLDEAAQRFGALLSAAVPPLSPVAVDLVPGAMWWGDVRVSPVGHRADKALTALHAAGLRGFIVHPGTGAAELARFALVVARDWSRRAPFEPELADLLAGANLVGVSVTLLGGVRLQAAPASPGDARELLIRAAARVTGAADAASLVDGILSDLQRAPATELGARQDVPEKLRIEANHITRGTDVTTVRTGRVVFEALRLATGPDVAADLLSAVANHVVSLLADGEVEAAADLVRPILALLDGELFPNWPHWMELRAEARSLLGARTSAAIVGGWRIRPISAAWRGPLYTLARLASDHDEDLRLLCSLAASLPHRDLRRPIADVLLDRVERRSSALLELLALVEPSTCGALLLALGELDDPTLIEPIMGHLRSAHAEVREDALAALRKHQSPRIKQMVRDALSDPSRGVRMEALRYIAVYRDLEAAPIMLDRLRRAGATEADADELKALAISFGLATRSGGQADLEGLASGTLGAVQDEARPAALHGLLAKGEAGQEALERLAARTPELRAAVAALTEAEWR
jgi:HEAT repeats